MIQPSHYIVKCTSDTQASDKRINEDTCPYIDQHKIDKRGSDHGPDGTRAKVARQERDSAQDLPPNRATSPSKNISI